MSQAGSLRHVRIDPRYARARLKEDSSEGVMSTSLSRPRCLRAVPTCPSTLLYPHGRPLPESRRGGSLQLSPLMRSRSTSKMWWPHCSLRSSLEMLPPLVHVPSVQVACISEKGQFSLRWHARSNTRGLPPGGTLLFRVLHEQGSISVTQDVEALRRNLRLHWRPPSPIAICPASLVNAR